MPFPSGLRSYWRPFVVICAVCAALFFLYARWSRRAAPLDDFGTVYGAARCWMDGQNPYRDADVSRAFHSAGGYADVQAGSAARPSVYLLPAMPIFASVAWLRWESAREVWIPLCSVSFLAAAFVVARQIPLPMSGQIFLGSLMLVLCKPFSTGMWFGNPSMLVIGVVILSAGLAVRRHDVAAGILLGFALAVKPQLATGLLAALVLARQWTALGLGAAFVGVATGVAAARASSLPVLKIWLDTQRENLAMSLAPGNINDPSLRSVYGYQFLNVQTLVGVFTSHAAIGNVIAWLGCAALVALYVAMRRREGRSDPWADFAFFTTVFLAPVYHRNYDGQVVMILLPWAVTLAQSGRFRMAASGSFCIALMLAGSFLWTLALFGAASGGGSIMTALAMRHQAVLVVGLSWLLAVTGGLSASAIIDEAYEPQRVRRHQPRRAVRPKFTRRAK